MFASPYHEAAVMQIPVRRVCKYARIALKIGFPLDRLYGGEGLV
jgi:hypothetical protein